VPRRRPACPGTDWERTGRRRPGPGCRRPVPARRAAQQRHAHAIAGDQDHRAAPAAQGLFDQRCHRGTIEVADRLGAARLHQVFEQVDAPDAGPGALKRGGDGVLALGLGVLVEQPDEQRAASGLAPFLDLQGIAGGSGEIEIGPDGQGRQPQAHTQAEDAEPNGNAWQLGHAAILYETRGSRPAMHA